MILRRVEAQELPISSNHRSRRNTHFAHRPNFELIEGLDGGIIGGDH